jgi:hypothetical protein
MGDAATPIRAGRLARRGMVKFENEKLLGSDDASGDTAVP